MKYIPWPDIKNIYNQKYRYCVRCGAAYNAFEMDFEGAYVAPTVGETLTGETSGKTAVVESFTLQSGAYGAFLDKEDGDIILEEDLDKIMIEGVHLPPNPSSRGTIVVTSPSGDFTDGEIINGSTSGAAFLTCRAYVERRYGHRYPDSMLANIDGKDYCMPHAASHAKSVIFDRDGRVDIDDSTY